STFPNPSGLFFRCVPNPFRVFFRSSEMLLASLAAITRNGCARSAFQPHLAGVFAFWVRTKTCPLFSAGRLEWWSGLSRLSQEMAVRDRHSSRIWPGCSLSGCGPKPVRFFLPVVCNAARVSRGYHEKWLCAIGIRAASGRGVRFLVPDQHLSAFCHADACHRL